MHCAFDICGEERSAVRAAVQAISDYLLDPGEELALDNVMITIHDAPPLKVPESACCAHEDLDMNGGCRNCGDPAT